MSTSLKVRMVRLSALLMLGVLVACGDTSGTAPGPVIPRPVSVVAVSPERDTLIAGQQLQLSATPKDVDGRPLQRAVSWHSENEVVATVTANGTMTALARGSTAIVATSEGKTGRADIHVMSVPVAQVRLSVSAEVVLEWDGTVQLAAIAFDAQGNELPGRDIVWTSTHPSVATVGTNGQVQAVSEGTSMLSATIDGVSATIGARVKPAPVGRVTLDANPSGLEVGETVFFAALVESASGQPIQRQVTWTTSAPAVATVQGSSLSLAGVHGVGSGTVTITASVGDKSASVTFSVAHPPLFDLLYTRWTGTTAAELFVLGLGQGAHAPVRLNAGSVSRDPSPSPDGLRIAFAVSQTDLTTGQQQHDLYIVNRNGLGMRRLTQMPGLEDQPAWSPDGSKILFHATDALTQRNDLWTINADGTALTNLTAAIGPHMTDKRDPSWSSDGTRIAFVGTVAGEHKIWIMNANGSNPVQVTRDAGFDASPAWSPTNDRIAFSRYNTANPTWGYDIMIVAVATGASQRLAQPGDQRLPAWSPDGNYIAVAGSERAGLDPQLIYTMRPDGTGLRLRTLDPAWGGGTSPAWIRR